MRDLKTRICRRIFFIQFNKIGVKIKESCYFTRLTLKTLTANVGEENQYCFRRNSTKGIVKIGF